MAKQFETMDEYINHLYDTTPVCDDSGTEEHENPFSKAVIKARKQLLDDAFGEDEEKKITAIRVLRDKYRLLKVSRMIEGKLKTIYVALEEC